MLITFSGLDGSGKSTLIGWLRTALERHGYAVTVLHIQYDVGVYACVRGTRNVFLRLLGRSVPRLHVPRPAVGVGLGPMVRRVRNALVWSRVVRWLVYPLDLLVFTLYRAYFEFLTRRIVIMDRYFYDTLVDLGGARHAWSRVLTALTPTPDVPVLLDVLPHEALARKQEYAAPYLERRWQAYQTVLGRVPSCVRLPNQHLEHATTQLWHVVSARLPGPPTGRRRWVSHLHGANEGGR